MAGLLIMAPSMPAPDMDPVAAELMHWCREPFDLLTANCGLSVLTYVGRATGQSVPAWLRAFGRFSIRRLTRGEAAFVEVGRRALEQMGCHEVGAPVRGDVGLVRLTNGLTAAISIGEKWAARADRGYVVEPAECVIAWRLPCPLR